ncbi:MAG: hypothetical protein GY854_19065 [Deltaproteobacteria bacterium]|nr:hypothetical protein [Deltaproteobacteria bacterium]
MLNSVNKKIHASCKNRYQSQAWRRPRPICRPSFLLALFAFLSVANADEFNLVPGDEVRVFIPGMQPPERIIQVNSEGELDLGMNGKVHVAGNTTEKAEALLKTHLKKYLRSTAGVTLLLDKAKRSVLVTGKVANPGLYVLGPFADLWQAIDMAGGLTPGADLTRVIISRQGLEIPVDVRSYLTRDTKEPLPTLRAGDVLFVSAEPGLPLAESGAAAFLGLEGVNRKVFVIGAVVTPGIYDRSESIDILTAVLLAGGPVVASDLGHVAVVTQKRRISVDLQAVLSGKTLERPQFPDEGGAIVYVPSLEENIDNRIGAHINVVGPFARTGRIPVSGPIKLIDAIGIVGGPQEAAKLHEVSVIQEGSGFTLVSEYDLEEYFEEGGGVGRALVYPGSTVYIGRRSLIGFQTTMQTVTTLAMLSTTAVMWMTFANAQNQEGE